MRMSSVSFDEFRHLVYLYIHYVQNCFTKGLPMQVELKIFDAVNQLEKRNGRRYTESQIAQATGLHRHTIASLMRGKPDRVIAKILAFFESEGAPVAINDLFVTLPTPESESSRA